MMKIKCNVPHIVIIYDNYNQRIQDIITNKYINHPNIIIGSNIAEKQLTNIKRSKISFQLNTKIDSYNTNKYLKLVTYSIGCVTNINWYIGFITLTIPMIMIVIAIGFSVGQ